MDNSIERPKRNSHKKWDPNFVASKNSATQLIQDDQEIKKGRYTSLSPKGSQVSNSKFKNSQTSKKLKMDNNSESLSNKSNYNDVSLNLLDEIYKHKKECDKFGCREIDCKVTCFAMSSERCPRDTGGISSRWYHVSCAEHYCNECFDHFYRSTKGGNATYTEWKKIWMNSCLSEACIKLFFMDTLLPFWVQCIECNKWREFRANNNITEDFVGKFTCSSDSKNMNCDFNESKLVNIVKTCPTSLLSTPYLCSTPIAPFLTNYYADGVSLSSSASMARPSNLKSIKIKLEENGDEEKETNIGFPVVSGIPSYFQPFIQPQMPAHARAFPPDSMTSTELEEFPQFARNPQIYLIIRNTALVLWTLNPKKVLTIEMCIKHLICRGLVRIRCIHELPYILFYLSVKGYINTGIFYGVIPAKLDNKKVVVIVGAGVAGLAAARHLTNFGFTVMVLESRDTIGGRIRDFNSMGLCVSKGPQVINGCTNNPITLICHQTNTRLVLLNESCTLIDDSGQIVSLQSTANMELHFNALLDNINTWRKQKPRKDVSLLDKLNEMHQEFIEETQISFTEEEDCLFDFNVRHMELISAASLKKISVLNFDHNEKYPQFVGASSIAPNGLLQILEHLAKDIDVRLNSLVSNIDYNKNGVKITTFGGTEYKCDHVIVTIPLASLKREIIKFTPPLPTNKLNSFQKMGIGQMEKIILKFENRFWMKKFRGCDSFGCVSKSDSNDLFIIFHDLTARIPLKEMSFGILVTAISGDNLEKIKDLSESDLIRKCLDQLCKYFPEENIPEPMEYLVTHWRNDVNSGMSFSYMPIDTDATIIQDIALPVMNRIYFAGEATNDEHPQSVAGAYLSGIRDAGAIIMNNKI